MPDAAMAAVTLAGMPMSPPDPAAPPQVVLLESPREAAERGLVYRRRNREQPRERGLKLVAMTSSLLVHIVVLAVAVLGPAYEPEALPERPESALLVRLIENKPEPPPPPPVRGTPPRERGPSHRGRAVVARPAVHRAPSSPPLPPIPQMPALAQVPVPAMEPPVLDTEARTSAPEPTKVTAAPIPPVTLPTPAPTPDLQPVPLAGEPPTVTLDTPTVARPVPPAFQPEIPRKPQLEGNRPIPPPPSLAMPELPPQVPPKVAPPTIAMVAPQPPTPAPASVVPAPAPPPAAPPAPDLQPVPLPAQVAPTVNLQPRLTAPTPVVATERPQVQAPSIRVAEPELAPVPPAPPAPSLIEQPHMAMPEAPALSMPAPRVAVSPVTVPPLPTPSVSAAPAPAKAPSKMPSAETPEPSAAAMTKTAAPANEVSVPAEENAKAPADVPDVSTSPEATPAGSDTATPGVPTGVEQPPPSAPEAPQGARLSNDAGQGSQPDATGTDGASGKASSGGPKGEYIQLRPHGDTDIMSHRIPGIDYTPTRFEQDWAPQGESSIDTALRHAVEKTTGRHTFHLPRGVRIECVVMPLFPMVAFGCHNPDPPAKRLGPEVYRRLNLPPPQPLAPPPPSPAASIPPPAAPIFLDNSAKCATARVTGGPPPPGCASGLPSAPLAPARSGSSWVPASDQFH